MPFISGGSSSASGGGTTKLFTQTLSADGASLDTGANGVASGYASLCVVASVRSARAASTFDTLLVQFNADSGTTLYFTSYTFGTANGSTAISNAGTGLAGVFAEMPAATAVANHFGSVVLWIPGYTKSDRSKTVSGLVDYAKANSAGNIISANLSGIWNNTAAITRITLVSGTGATNLLAGSMFTVYGMS